MSSFLPFCPALFAFGVLLGLPSSPSSGFLALNWHASRAWEVNLKHIYPIERGYDDLAGCLSALDADITVQDEASE